MTNLSSYFGTKQPGCYGFEPKYVLRRLKSARECADRGGRLLELAKAWGVTYHGAYNFLVKHDLDLLKRVLANGPVTFQVSSEEAQRRIRTCFDHLKSGGTLTSAARELNITLSALTLWLKRHAPDGIEQAYEDYIGSEEEELA